MSTLTKKTVKYSIYASALAATFIVSFLSFHESRSITQAGPEISGGFGSTAFADAPLPHGGASGRPGDGDGGGDGGL